MNKIFKILSLIFILIFSFRRVFDNQINENQKFPKSISGFLT